MIDDNAAQAAIRAGYSQKGARQQGQRLLTNAAILRAVADLARPLRMMAIDKVAAAIQQRLRAGRMYRNVQVRAEIRTGLAEPESLFRALRKVEPVWPAHVSKCWYRGGLQRASCSKKTARSIAVPEPDRT